MAPVPDEKICSLKSYLHVCIFEKIQTDLLMKKMKKRSKKREEKREVTVLVGVVVAVVWTCYGIL